MEVQTLQMVRERRNVAAETVVAYVGAAAFVVASVWATLASRGITVASKPAQRLGLSVHENELIYLRWLMSTQPQERIYTSIAILAFSCLLATAVSLRGRTERALPALAVQGVAVGAVLWVTEHVAHLGADQAIGLLTTHHYSTQTISGIGFTIDMVTRAMEITAFAMLGAGAVSFALDAFRGRPRRPRWGALTAAIGASMILSSWAALAGNGDLGDLLVALVGIVLLPVWMCWSAAVLRR
jgi:hypothetical protein